MIISIHAEKQFDKIQHSILTKTLIKRNRNEFLNLMKDIYNKPRANIILTSTLYEKFWAVTPNKK